MNLVLKMNYATRIEAAVNVHFVDKSTTTSQLQELFHHQQADHTLLKVVHYVQIGWPEMRNEVEEEAHHFWSNRHNLYMESVGENSILLMNGRTVIPTQQQKKTLNNLHEGHQGLKKLAAMLVILYIGLG